MLLYVYTRFDTQLMCLLGALWVRTWGCVRGIWRGLRGANVYIKHCECGCANVRVRTWGCERGGAYVGERTWECERGGAYVYIKHCECTIVPTCTLPASIIYIYIYIYIERDREIASHLAPFGSLWLPLVTFWFPFGSLLAPFGSLWRLLAPFGSLLALYFYVS